MTTVKETHAKKYVQKQANFEVKPHPQSSRMYHIEVSNQAIQDLFNAFPDVDSQRLIYVPFMRYVVAGKLREILGQSFQDAVRGILHERETGGFTIGVQGQTTDTEKYVLYATAITHLIGSSNFDAMTGTYFARFTVKDTDNSDSYLRQAYRLFTLHTDGTFVDEPTDWLLMMKMQEENAVGGESRLLHLDDWEDLEKFSSHPLAGHHFTYKAPASKNVVETINRPTFFQQNNGTCICFIDQFVCPETVEQSIYLKELSESMENSPSTLALKLPVGDLVMLNNTFWLHGRAAFEKNPNLFRELMRQRGVFAK
ncbi:MAG: glutarate dioxygenase GlaH [Clostridia bacterium]